MTTLNATFNNVGNDSVKFTYGPMATGDDSAPIGPNFSDFADRTVQVLGTFGGASLVVEGSNDGGTTWFILDDPQGVDMSFTAATGKSISEMPELTRCRVSGGAGVALNVIFTMRRERSRP